MVSQITLGTFFNTTDGKTVLGGAGGSGLDTQSLIDSLVKAKSITATQYQDKIDLNNKQSSALSQFQTLLGNFQSASDALRNPPGVANYADNAFAFTNASVSANGAGYLSVISSPGADIQNYTVNNITQLASAAKQSTGNITVANATTSIVAAANSPVAGQFTAGTVTINGQAITLNEGDSLNTIAAKFNAVSGATGINATVIKVADNTFKLAFASTATGAAASFDLKSTSIDPGNTVFGNVNLSTATTGQNAKFRLNGIDIERSSNSIGDVISGVTFNLQQVTSNDVNSDSNIGVSVTNDTTTIQNSIVNYVKSYNALRTFYAQQTQLKSDGTFSDTSVLAGNQTFRSIMNNITAEVTRQVTGLSGITSIADIGLTLAVQPASGDTPQVDNIINVNDGQLSSVLATNFNQVKNLFGFNLQSNSPDLKVFSSAKELPISNFTLSINPGARTFQVSYLKNGQTVTEQMTGTAIVGSVGYTLTGQAGTALEGLTLIYANNSIGTVNVSVTQGVAHQTYNSIQSAVAATTGSIAVELQTIKDTNGRLNDSITKVNDQVDQYRQQLLIKFGALEQAIAKTNNLLQSLTAQQEAAYNASH